MNTGTRAYVVCGSPAAGKSTYAARLAQDRQAALLDIDTCTEQIVQASLASSGRDPADRDSAYYKENFRQPVYDTLIAIARENLLWLNTVIVGPFTREISDPVWPEVLTAALQATVEIHVVTCAPEQRRERMAQRGNPRDRQKLQNWDEHLRYAADAVVPAFDHVRVDTSTP